MSLPSEQMFLPLGRGLNTQPDPRALGDGELAVAKDCQFVPGGLITRYPYGSHSSTISNIRKLVTYGDELLAFTKDTLYSWSPANSTWMSRGTHLAPKVTERSVFARTTEQTLGDRAELSGVVVYVWLDTGASPTAYIAAEDSTTGAVLLSPTSLGANTTRPKLLALSSVILLFYDSASTLVVQAITPSSIASFTAGGATTVQSSSEFGSMYDVVQYASNTALVVWKRNTTTSYGYATVTSALSVTASTKARACVGPIAVHSDASSDTVCVVRNSAVGAARADILVQSTLADSGTVDIDIDSGGSAVGSTWDQATVGLAGTTYRAFWSDAETTGHSSNFVVKTNTITTAGVAGTQTTFRRELGLVSRAFTYDSNVYVWLGFMGSSAAGGLAELYGARGQLQNTYFLYRADGLLVAKAACAVSGGNSAGAGLLPTVQSLSSTRFAWCGLERRVIPLGSGTTDYADRGPRSIVVEFDSDEARRCVQLGKTLYVAGGGQILQYDGEGLAEVGFHIYPWYFEMLESTGGSKTQGVTYAYKVTWSWTNAKGELDRSTTATIATIATSGGSGDEVQMNIVPLHTTLKQTRVAPAVEVWGSLASPGVDSPFYRASDDDPSNVGAGDNVYIPNDDTLSTVPSGGTFDDILSDTDLSKRENNPENGAILENIAPPPATLIAANEERLFLAGISDDPYAVWPSKLRGEGEVASFHDSLVFRVPMTGGVITALAIWQGVLVVFCERAVYAYDGQGPDNTGAGQAYGPARIVASDMGAVSQEAVAVSPQGIVFKSSKGWHLLGGAFPQYIGGPVKEYDSDTVESIDVMENDQHVRILTNNRMLVLDYSISPPQWAEWTIASRVSSTVYGGVHYVATTGTVYQQLTSYTSLAYGIDIETAWIKMDNALGAKLVRRIIPLGEHRSAHDLRLRYAVDYKESDASGITWVDDESWTSTPATAGGPLEVRFGPSRQRCKAFKIRLTAYAVGSVIDPPTGEALRLTGIGLEVAFDRRLSRNLPAAQKF